MNRSLAMVDRIRENALPPCFGLQAVQRIELFDLLEFLCGGLLSALG